MREWEVLMPHVVIRADARERPGSYSEGDRFRVAIEEPEQLCWDEEVIVERQLGFDPHLAM